MESLNSENGFGFSRGWRNSKPQIRSDQRKETLRQLGRESCAAAR